MNKKPTTLLFSKHVLTGIGQIMLQENPITGILFLAGIFLGSLSMGSAAIVGAVVGTVVAYVLTYDSEKIKQGLYGFSPALVGVAIVLLFKSALISWILIVVGSALAAIVQHFFMQRNIPVFTLPFVLVTWLLFYGTMYFYPSLLAEVKPLTPQSADYYLFAIKGFGQVIFQPVIWAGGLFVLGILIHSKMAALYGFAGSLLAGILAYPFVSAEAIANGLVSYNAVLCAIVFAGHHYKNALRAFLAVALSVAFTIWFMENQFLVLTFPFVAASCITLFIGKKSKKL